MAFNPRDLNPSAIKSLVDNLSRHLKAHPLPTPIKRSGVQELVAATLGWPNWHAAITAAKANAPSTAIAKASKPRPALAFPPLLSTRPDAPMLSLVSGALMEWLDSRPTRPIEVMDSGDEFILTHEEVSSQTGMLGVWLWRIYALKALPSEVKLSFWTSENALCRVIAELEIADQNPSALVKCLKSAWEELEAASPGPRIQLTSWWEDFKSAMESAPVVPVK